MIDSTVDAMIVIDARGAIEVFNRAAERMFGYSEEETLGCNEFQNLALAWAWPRRSGWSNCTAARFASIR